MIFNIPLTGSRLRRAALAPLLLGALVTPSMAHAGAFRAQPHAVAAAPCIPGGHGPGVIPSIAFGRQGGNIMPMRVAIYGDGVITYQGAAPLSVTYTISPLAVLGLQRLAQAEGFWSMPLITKSPGVLPDVASLFITVRAGCATTTRTIQVRGTQPGGFSELYATLMAATAISNAPSPAPPAGTPPPPTNGPQIVTQDNVGQILQYTIGQSFLLKLGDSDHWTLHFSNPAIFQLRMDEMVIKGAQGIFVAKTPGATTLTVVGDPLCRSSKPACELPSRVLVLQFIATATS